MLFFVLLILFHIHIYIYIYIYCPSWQSRWYIFMYLRVPMFSCICKACVYVCECLYVCMSIQTITTDLCSSFHVYLTSEQKKKKKIICPTCCRPCSCINKIKKERKIFVLLSLSLSLSLSLFGVRVVGRIILSFTLYTNRSRFATLSIRAKTPFAALIDPRCFAIMQSATDSFCWGAAGQGGPTRWRTLDTTTFVQPIQKERVRELERERQRERERERERECVCVCVCVCVRETETERECVCVCVCMWERERESARQQFWVFFKFTQ